ncbi:MAG: carbohydrate kinase family protein [Candidatus Bathyarchaeota archaeon]|nr:carbohydrate kinase family protein [Candidatus Bathyarchaeota archaeon]
MEKTAAFDVVTVGHFVMDIIDSPRIPQPKVSLGGPPAFVSLAASKLGARVGVISKVGGDFQRKLAWLRENNVDVSHVHVVEDAPTTSFILTYTDGGRRLQMKNRAPQIGLEDIPTALHAKAIHVAPVAGELPTEIIPKLKERTPVLSIDPQGFLREFDHTGRARLRGLGDATFLQHCDVFKSSLREAKVLTGHSKLAASIDKIREWGVETILVTMGKKGTLARFADEFYHIPACTPTAVKDPTGAGDAFMGGFLAEYTRGREPVWCCCVGSAAASFVVEEVGSRRFGEKTEVYERATEIYEKDVKPLSQDAFA